MDLRDVTPDRPMFHRVACVAARLCLSQRMRAGSLCEWGRKVNKRRLGVVPRANPAQPGCVVQRLPYTKVCVLAMQ